MHALFLELNAPPHAVDQPIVDHDLDLLPLRRAREAHALVDDQVLGLALRRCLVYYVLEVPQEVSQGVPEVPFRSILDLLLSLLRLVGLVERRDRHVKVIDTLTSKYTRLYLFVSDARTEHLFHLLVMVDYSFIVDEEDADGQTLEDADPLSAREVSLVVEPEDLVLELLGLEAEFHAEDREEEGREPCLIS